MSLINQMLQDLEKRTQDDGSPGVPQYAQFGTAAPEPQHDYRLGLALISLLLIVVTGYFFLRPGNTLTAASGAAPSKNVAAKADLASAAITASATTSTASSIANNDGIVTDDRKLIDDALLYRDLPLSLKLSVDIDKTALRQTVKAEAITPPVALQKDVFSHNRVADSAEHDGNGNSRAIVNVDAGNLNKTGNLPVQKNDQETKRVEKNQTISVATNVKAVAITGMVLDKSELSKNAGKEQNFALASPNISPPTMIKEVSSQQRAEGEFRQASVYQQQGRFSEAILALEQALKLDSTHAPARQSLISLLLDNNRQDEAMRELKNGLNLDSNQVNFAMILARLQVERAKVNEAVDTLQRSLGAAQERADYLSFLAALKQKLGQHKEAIRLYRQALQKHHQNGVWWMGLGISLQAEGLNQDAIDAYKQSKIQSGLSSELQAFIDQKISQLQK